ncbi:DUF485 domain-containing protein [Nocardiopsis algeriensis]|uniref:Uncharacterized membrane protein (DUF485 family) n=1 Tax=Nocardiopsis algeriensis TaxID=1478215 RepID=A0A841IJN0_9ACTN|nr:DUF485 domain-containing protein [Nocardiopsis algeriensis]MBB6118144.1 uncharacterized membrane protein (DUF485 family) [Nocardiopsis algeriensis]
MATDRSTKDSPPSGGGENGQEVVPAFVAMHDDPRFQLLKRKLFRFVLPASITFLAWYLLYVLMSAFGRDVMGVVLFGSVNVALVFGILQFASTFGIAVLYTMYARKNLDPLAAELRGEIEGGRKGAAE